MGNAIKHIRAAAAAAFGLAAVFTLLSFTPFGCRKWNNPPEAPSSPSPDSGARNVGIRPVLSWVSDDTDGDTVRFDVYLGTDSFDIRDSVPGAPLMEAGWAHDTLTSSALQLNRRYYWQVLARDSHGDSAMGPLWTFTTTATNRPPNRPNSPSPDSGAIGVPRLATLSWKGGDPDSGDVARYDIYFGIAPGSLQMVDSLLVGTSYATESLAYDSNYYWKIVSRDNSGARDTGSVWRFRTASELRITDPDSGELLQIGRPDTIWWAGGPTVGLTLLGGPGYPLSGMGRRSARVLDAGDSTVVYRSSDDGTTWLRVGRATIPNRMPWVVPGPATAQARVRVKFFLPGDTIVAVSGRFVTYDSVLPSPITVTQPTDSSRWTVGSVHSVTWTGGTDAIDSTTVYYSTDGGTSWQRQGKAVLPGEFQWTVPDAPSMLARIDVRAYLGGSIVTGQSPVFEVAALPSPITVTQPTASSRWIVGSVHSVTWTGGTDAVDSTAVYFSGNNGVTWQRQGKAVAPGEFQWTVPGTPSTAARIEVRAYLGADVVTGQSPLFEVVEPRFPDTVIATVTVGSRPRALCWDSTDNRVFVSCYSDSSLAVIDGAGNTRDRHGRRRRLLVLGALEPDRQQGVRGERDPQHRHDNRRREHGGARYAPGRGEAGGDVLEPHQRQDLRRQQPGLQRDHHRRCYQRGRHERRGRRQPGRPCLEPGQQQRLRRQLRYGFGLGH